MSKTRRLSNTPIKQSKLTPSKVAVESPNKPYLDEEVHTARGRLMGALMAVVEDEYGDIEEESDSKQKEKEKTQGNHPNPSKSYVMKLFDKSVDLSQFNEDTPLYPICRAWMANKPTANYNDLGSKFEDPPTTEDSIELPDPVGDVVSRIPELLPEQAVRNKDNINLDYEKAPPPNPSGLLREHMARWGRVRRAWLAQAGRAEARYSASQAVLENIRRK